MNNTPGPWRVQRNHYGLDVYPARGASCICHVCPSNDAANAQLIAAAPELLTILEHVTHLCSQPNPQWSDLYGTLKQAARVIKHAKNL